MEQVLTGSLEMRAMVATMRPGDLWTAALRAQPVSAQYAVERPRIPSYLDSHNHPRSQNVLDYADWDTIRIASGLAPPVTAGGQAIAVLFPVRHHAVDEAADDHLASAAAPDAGQEQLLVN